MTLIKEVNTDEIVTIIRQQKPGKKWTLIEKSEQDAFKILKDAFTTHDLAVYVFTIQDYFADKTDALATDNPILEDYLNSIIPEFTESYDNSNKDLWLNKLQEIINQAQVLISGELS
ncbi:hypothetical protein [Bombilactobacillus bombi]|uniref:hypothetical protein n=1 Tax=Bombilactobacillus bombi TaxID=1303590 RepID=UPI0038F65DD0